MCVNLSQPLSSPGSATTLLLCIQEPQLNPIDQLTNLKYKVSHIYMVKLSSSQIEKRSKEMELILTIYFM